MAVIALVLAGCGGGGSSSVAQASTPVPAEKSFSSCKMDAADPSAANSLGSFQLVNNIWNPDTATSYSECVNATINEATGIKSAQFQWNFVTTKIDVKSYPSIVYGWHPGYSKGNPAKLPASVASLPDLNATATVNTTCSGECVFNTGFDLLFTKTATPTTWAPTAEIMIWTELKDAGHAGNYVTDVTIAGIPFALYQGPITVPVTSAGPGGSWNYILYVAKAPINTFNFNLKAFVSDAVARGYVSPTDYLPGVEFGTEVTKGQGTTTITGYSIQ